MIPLRFVVFEGSKVILLAKDETGAQSVLMEMGSGCLIVEVRIIRPALRFWLAWSLLVRRCSKSRNYLLQRGCTVFLS